MNSKPTVLIAGISGVLGTKIANAVLDKGEMNVRGLVRSPNNDKLNDLKARAIILKVKLEDKNYAVCATTSVTLGACQG